MFKNLANFSLFTFFTTGSAYLATKYNNERKLHHPVVSEALRLAENDDQISGIIGFPITWSSNARNFVDKSEKLYNAEFFIEGPKGKLFLRVGAECLPLESIQAEYESLSKELQETPVQDAPLKLSEKNKLEGFYILDPKTKSFYESNIKSSDAKLEEIKIPSDSLFWGIGYLFADIDTRKVVLIPRTISDKTSSGKDVRSFVIDAKANVNKSTLKDLQEEQQQLIPRALETEGKSEKEIEKMQRFRQRERLRNMNGPLFFTMLGVGALGVVSYFVYRRFRGINLRNSFLHLSAMEIIKKNEAVTKELGRNFNIMGQIRGEAKQGKADFEIDAYGSKKKVSFRIKGSLDEKTDKWTLERIDMITRDKKSMEIIKEERIF